MNQEQQRTEVSEAELDPTQNEVFEEGQQEEADENQNNADESTDDLDTLLEQFDAMSSAKEEAAPQQPQQKEKPSQPEVNNGPPDTRLDEIYTKYQQDQRRQARQDVDNAVNTVKESSPVLTKLPDYILEGAINKMAAEDPRIGKAFTMRHEDPALWKKTLNSIGKRMTRDMGARQDNEASDNIAAVRASVNNQSGGGNTDGPSDEDIANMTPGQFDRYKREQGYV